MATAKQLKAIRKKYHLGEFKRSRSKPRVKHKIKHTRRLKNMARKRHARRYVGSKSINIMSTAVGVGGYILYEALLEPKVAAMIGQGMLLNVAELAAGVYLSKKGGWVGNVGKAAIVLNTYQIIKPLLANISGSSY
jgi:hypothetical protein